MDLKTRIAAFVVHVNTLIDENTKKHYPNLSSDVVEAVYLSDKWCRITKRSSGVGESVYCFIALTDFANKTLGQVKAGDIHRPATWKAPAKHSRGSVFQEDFNNCANPYGVAYLK